jgi:hypothetical protein
MLLHGSAFGLDESYPTDARVEENISRVQPEHEMVYIVLILVGKYLASLGEHDEQVRVKELIDGIRSEIFP